MRKNKLLLTAVISAAVALSCTAVFTGCNETPATPPPPSEEETVLSAPQIRQRNGIIKWSAVDGAESYSVYYSVNGQEHTASQSQTELSYTPRHEEIGEYTYWVVAVNTSDNLVSARSNTVKITVTAPALAKPVLTFEGDTLKWNAVENAANYEVKFGKDGTPTTQTGCTFDISATKPSAAGTYYYYVTAKAPNQNYTDSVTSAIAYTVNDGKLSIASTQLTNSKVYLVGDSTVCGFSDSYYLPRYGYGTQLAQYLDLGAEASVENLAMSGRSSYSFTTEGNYTTLETNIKAGDYLIIGFGHNDEKGEDQRYANPNLSSTDATKLANRPVSFKYILNEYYLKLALDAGATPILCTPIVRASDKNDYSGSNGHITGSTGSYAGGDYAKAIRELGEEKNVTVVDLTAITKADYTAVGYENASDYHAFTSTKNGVRAGVDGTHTNMYGAKTNAYYLATELKKSDNPLGAHVKADIQRPTYAADYFAGINSSYEEPEYKTFTPAQKSSIWTGVTAKDWYGTVFGDVGSENNLNSKNFTIAQGEDDKSFKVASNFDNMGKIASGADGLACVFRQVDAEMNFEISATVKVDSYTDGTTQSGFGIMLRDDIYIDKYSKTVNSNYVSAGNYTSSAGANILFSREGATLKTTNNKGTIAVGDTHTLSITKTNQTVIVKYDGYTYTYTDFDFVATDNDYVYICLYATRGAGVTFTNVTYTEKGLGVTA